MFMKLRKINRVFPSRALAVVTAVSLALTACGGATTESTSPAVTTDGTTEATEAGSTTSAETTAVETTAVETTAAATTSAAPAELQEVVFAVSTCSSYAYGFHMALALGFFEEEGLDVNMQCVDGSSAVAQQLAAGNVDVGAGNAASHLPVFNRGEKLYPFFAYTRGAQADLVVPTDSPIQTITDLVGQSIGVAGLAGAETTVAKGYLVGEGLDPDRDVTFIEVGAEPPNVQIALDRGDIQAVAATQGDLGLLVSAGLDLRSIVPEEVRSELASYPSGLFFATEDTKDDTEMLGAMARAVARAYTVAFANPAAAVCILADVIPEEYVDPEVGRAQFDAGYQFTQVPESGGSYSFNEELADPSIFQGFIDFYAAAGVLDAPFEAESVIVDVTEEIQDFDQEATKAFAAELPSDCEAAEGY
jgi:NitT/TauT family transport system substrate-binding protein